MNCILHETKAAHGGPSFLTVYTVSCVQTCTLDFYLCWSFIYSVASEYFFSTLISDVYLVFEIKLVPFIITKFAQSTTEAAHYHHSKDQMLELGSSASAGSHFSVSRQKLDCILLFEQLRGDRKAVVISQEGACDYTPCQCSPALSFTPLNCTTLYLFIFNLDLFFFYFFLRIQSFFVIIVSNETNIITIVSMPSILSQYLSESLPTRCFQAFTAAGSLCLQSCRQ